MNDKPIVDSKTDTDEASADESPKTPTKAVATTPPPVGPTTGPGGGTKSSETEAAPQSTPPPVGPRRGGGG